MEEDRMSSDMRQTESDYDRAADRHYGRQSDDGDAERRGYSEDNDRRPKHKDSREDAYRLRERLHLDVDSRRDSYRRRERPHLEETEDRYSERQYSQDRNDRQERGEDDDRRRDVHENRSRSYSNRDESHSPDRDYVRDKRRRSVSKEREQDSYKSRYSTDKETLRYENTGFSHSDIDDIKRQFLAVNERLQLPDRDRPYEDDRDRPYEKPGYSNERIVRKVTLYSTEREVTPDRETGKSGHREGNEPHASPNFQQKKAMVSKLKNKKS